MILKSYLYFSAWFLLMMAFIGCSSTKELSDENFDPAKESIEQIASRIPDYSNSLRTLKGKGRAIVSEPGNTERVSLQFASNRSKSLVKVRNGIGIEGGQLLTDGDTLLVYNKVDNYARKIPIRGGNLDNINRLASLNILDMLSYSVNKDQISTARENESLYKLHLSSGTKILVDKESGLIREVIQPKNSRLPYSRITYDAYTSIKEFTLPRRISIFGAEEKSKIALQLTNLELNPRLDTLKIDLPEDIRIFYR